MWIKRTSFHRDISFSHTTLYVTSPRFILKCYEPRICFLLSCFVVAHAQIRLVSVAFAWGRRFPLFLMSLVAVINYYCNTENKYSNEKDDVDVSNNQQMNNHTKVNTEFSYRYLPSSICTPL
jgi:hypothetical protein